MIRLSLNGKEKVFEQQELRPVDLIRSMKLRPRHVIIMQNGKAIHKDNFGKTQLNDGDEVTLLKMINGG
ncbi:MAG: sulfur carrier protein ThiS [Bacteroidales bacterium]|nr:sulfur carrier protein ThiS [Bacteroidales bacterium]